MARKKLVEEENQPIVVRKTKEKVKLTEDLQNATKSTEMLQNEAKETKKGKEPKKTKTTLKEAKKALKKDDKVEKKDKKVKTLEKEPETIKNTENDEPIVPAEIPFFEEDNKEPNIQKPKKTNKIRKHKKNKNKKNNFINGVGEKSEEILIADSNSDKSKKEYEVFKKLLIAQKTRQILYGEVYGVEPNEKLGKVIIAVMWNGVKISIPDSEYFEPNFEFGVRYQNSTKEEQMKRRANMAGYQNGAHVCFLVKAVTRDVITGGEYDGEYNIACVASRKEAMELMRDVYFYHKERIHAKNNIREIKINDIAEANVIAVKEDNIIVECFGVETRIPAREASEEYIENCKDFFSPGDTIKVKVKKLHINGNSSVYLTVTGKLVDSSKFINTMAVKSSYRGMVENVNGKKKIYNVRLRNGVLAGVLFDNVQGNIPLFIGDKVIVKVSKIKDTYVYGSAMKI